MRVSGGIDSCFHSFPISIYLYHVQPVSTLTSQFPHLCSGSIALKFFKKLKRTRHRRCPLPMRLMFVDRKQIGFVSAELVARMQSEQREVVLVRREVFDDFNYFIIFMPSLTLAPTNCACNASRWMILMSTSMILVSQSTYEIFSLCRAHRRMRT